MATTSQRLATIAYSADADPADPTTWFTFPDAASTPRTATLELVGADGPGSDAATLRLIVDSSVAVPGSSRPARASIPVEVEFEDGVPARIVATIADAVVDTLAVP